MLKTKIAKKLKSKQLKNFMVYGFGQAVNLISPLLVMPYIVFVCGEEGLGKVGVGFSFALIAVVLVDYGSYINGTKAVSINSNDRIILEEKFTTIYLSKFILLLIVLFLSSLIIVTVPFFQKDKLQLLLSLFIVVGQFINPVWFFQGIQNFKWISIINILSKVIYIVSVLLFIKKPEDYVYVNFFLGIGAIIAGLIGFIWIYKTYSFSFQRNVFPEALHLIREEFSITISQLFLSFYQYAPILVISYFGGNFMAGQYRIIDQVIMIFRTYFQMFFNFVYADVCLKIHLNINKGLYQWKVINTINYLFVVVLLITFYFNSERILLFFRINPIDLAFLATNFKIGLLVPVFIGVSLALKQLMFSINNDKQYIKITILSTVLSIVLLFSLLHYFGLKGAFFSTIIIEFFVIISYVLVLKSSFVRLKSAI